MRIELGRFLADELGNPHRRFVSSGIDSVDEQILRGAIVDAFQDRSPFPVATFKLVSGRFAVVRSRQTPIGESPEVQVLCMDESTYRQFGYHPLRVLDRYDLDGQAGHFSRAGRDPMEAWFVDTVDDDPSQRHLESALKHWSIERLGRLLDCVLVGSRVAIVTDGHSRQLISAVLSLLPPSCRRELELSGLTLDSQCYPFQLFLIGDSLECWQAFSNVGEISIVDFSSDPPIGTDLQHPWSQLAVRVIREDGIQAWFASLRELPDDLSMDKLGELAQLRFAKSSSLLNSFQADALLSDLTEVHPDLCFQQDVRSFSPPHESSKSLDLSRKEILHQLNRLDDAAFDAIAGSDRGLSRLEELWPQIKAQLASELIEESREQYVRLIVDRCEQRLSTDAGSSEAAQSAMDVLRLLFSRDTEV